jgi:hypothetical protein
MWTSVNKTLQVNNTGKSVDTGIIKLYRWMIHMVAIGRICQNWIYVLHVKRAELLWWFDKYFGAMSLK